MRPDPPVNAAGKSVEFPCWVRTAVLMGRLGHFDTQWEGRLGAAAQGNRVNDKLTICEG
jgi:hypothetical protein